jgi:hypothetical protein
MTRSYTAAIDELISSGLRTMMPTGNRRSRNITELLYPKLSQARSALPPRSTHLPWIRTPKCALSGRPQAGIRDIKAPELTSRQR